MKKIILLLLCALTMFSCAYGSKGETLTTEQMLYVEEVLLPAFSNIDSQVSSSSRLAAVDVSYEADGISITGTEETICGSSVGSKYELVAVLNDYNGVTGTLEIYMSNTLDLLNYSFGSEYEIHDDNNGLIFDDIATPVYFSTEISSKVVATNETVDYQSKVVTKINGEKLTNEESGYYELSYFGYDF